MSLYVIDLGVLLQAGMALCIIFDMTYKGVSSQGNFETRVTLRVYKWGLFLQTPIFF